MLEGDYGEVAGGGAEITHAELLLALAAEFGPVNDERARGRMDELGRRLSEWPSCLLRRPLASLTPCFGTSRASGAAVASPPA